MQALRTACKACLLLVSLYATTAQHECLIPLLPPTVHNCTCTGPYILSVRWFGRLGNNLIQLANVLRLAQATKSEVVVPPHKYFNQTSWSFSDGGDFECQLTVTDSYFYSHVCPAVLGPAAFKPATKRDMLQRYVFPAFQSALTQAHKAVVVHVRGGDVFSAGPPNVYVQPPLAFYSAVLSLPRYFRYHVILVVEDYLNPVVAVLKQQYTALDRYTILA